MVLFRLLQERTAGMTPAEQEALHKVNALLGHWRGGINPCTCTRCKDVVNAIARARREEREAIKETLCESCKQAV